MADDPFATLGIAADATPREIAAARRRLARSAHPDRGGDTQRMQALNAAYLAAVRRATSPADGLPPEPPRRRGAVPRVQHDVASFVISGAPPVAFEALRLAAATLGEVSCETAPHTIECVLGEPLRCCCRLDVVPDGSGSSISLIVEGYADDPAPDIEQVRDAWVRHVNELGQP